MVLKDNEFISVVMSAFNAENTISDAIESVLQQTYNKFDFIIINDGSTDRSGETIKMYAKNDDRIKVIEHPNKGMAQSLNIGIKSSNNNWIARFDADDIMLKHRLESQINFIKRNPHVKVVSCRAFYINEYGNILGKTINHIKTIEAYQKLIKNNDVIGLLHPGVMIEKKIFIELGGYRGKFWPAEDIDLWTRISEKGYAILIQDEVLMKYRLHKNSIVTSDILRSQLKFEWVKKCKECRINNMNEPDYESFLKELNSLSFFKKMNKKRKIISKINYRSAGYYFLNSNYYTGIVKLFISVLLKPSYAFGKLLKQLIF